MNGKKSQKIPQAKQLKLLRQRDRVVTYQLCSKANHFYRQSNLCKALMESLLEMRLREDLPSMSQDLEQQALTAFDRAVFKLIISPSFVGSSAQFHTKNLRAFKSIGASSFFVLDQVQFTLCPSHRRVPRFRLFVDRMKLVCYNALADCMKLRKSWTLPMDGRMCQPTFYYDLDYSTSFSDVLVHFCVKQ